MACSLCTQFYNAMEQITGFTCLLAGICGKARATSGTASRHFNKCKITGGIKAETLDAQVKYLISISRLMGAQARLGVFWMHFSSQANTGRQCSVWGGCVCKQHVCSSSGLSVVSRRPLALFSKFPV